MEIYSSGLFQEERFQCEDNVYRNWIGEMFNIYF